MKDQQMTSVSGRGEGVSFRVLVGDCLELAGAVGPVDCIVTSPPYWGLRDYGVGGAEQLGQEPSPAEYVRNLVARINACRKALRSTGTLWLNIGDTMVGGRNDGIGASSIVSLRNHRAVREAQISGVSHRKCELGPKSLIGIPWRVAFALQRSGWILRSEIIWAKPNPMPESVRDRPTHAHEHVFLFSRAARYFYEQLLEPSITVPGAHRNARDVWTIAQEPHDGEHTATMPLELARRCISGGCPAGGVVLDPFSGAGTVGRAAAKVGAEYVGIEINPVYAADSEIRLREAYAQIPLFGTSTQRRWR